MHSQTAVGAFTSYTHSHALEITPKWPIMHSLGHSSVLPSAAALDTANLLSDPLSFQSRTAQLWDSESLQGCIPVGTISPTDGYGYKGLGGILICHRHLVHS